MTNSSPVSKHLIRHWRSMALPKLKQGSTLSIRSQIQPTNVVLRPEWRDSGHASLEQWMPRQQETTTTTQPLVDMIVRVNQDRMTSIGRVAPDISIDLVPHINTTTATTHQSQPENKASILSHTPSKEVDKVILDDGTILPDSDKFSPPPTGSRRVEYHDGIAHIVHLLANDDEAEKVDPKSLSLSTSGTTLTLQIPEKINLVCDLSLHGGSISVEGKVEGDAELITSNGDIFVTKLRGHKIHLGQQQQRDCGSSTAAAAVAAAIDKPHNSSCIFASDLLEATKLTIKTCGRVRAKQVHGTHVQITVDDEEEEESSKSVSERNTHNEQSPLAEQLDADDEGSIVDIGALFVSGSGGATIDVKNYRHLIRRAVRVKSHHGPVRVSTSHMPIPTETCPLTGNVYPMIELGGVNGNCEVSINDTRVPPATTQLKEQFDWKSCLIHFDSLLPESISVVTADCGNISLTLDRKIEADLRLVSTTYGDEIASSATLLAEEDDDDMIANILGHLGGNTKTDNASTANRRKISIETPSFAMGPKSFQSDAVEYVQGIVTNKSGEPDSRFDRKMGGGGRGKINLEGAANQALDRFRIRNNHRQRTRRTMHFVLLWLLLDKVVS